MWHLRVGKMKILLLSHGLFAKELADSCRMIHSEFENVSSLCLTQEGIDTFSTQLKEYLKNNKEETVLFFCDLLHGSPYNQLCINMIDDPVNDYRIMTGMNLPMVMQAIIMSQTDAAIDTIVTKSKDAGMKGITIYEPK